MNLFHMHNWSKWSEPQERTYQTYDAPPALVPNQTLKTFSSLVQERICKTCGKYKWRKV